MGAEPAAAPARFVALETRLATARGAPPGAMDMRELPRRFGGFFIADEGTGIWLGGRALPRGPSAASVRRRASMLSKWE